MFFHNFVICVFFWWSSCWNLLLIFKNCIQFSSVTHSCLTLWNPMNRSMPGLSVHHQLPESTQTHVHWVGDAIQPWLLEKPLLWLDGHLLAKQPLLFNMLSRLIIAFFPRNKRLLISWLQSPSAVILEPKKMKSFTISIVSPSICHEVMGLDAMCTEPQKNVSHSVRMSSWGWSRRCSCLLCVVAFTV